MSMTFGVHPDPAIDFCIEVDVLEGLLFDVLHEAGGTTIAELGERIKRAMDFVVGGDQHAIAAKAKLREIEADFNLYAVR